MALAVDTLANDQRLPEQVCCLVESILEGKRACEHCEILGGLEVVMSVKRLCDLQRLSLEPLGFLVIAAVELRRAEICPHLGDEGMAVDRTQHLRGVGSYADIERYSNALNSGGYWPFENNVAYAAYDAQRFEVEATTAASLDPDDLVVAGWQGEVISEYADMPIAFPDAADLAQYDRLLIDVDMRCPDHSKPEFNNCAIRRV